MRHAYATVIFFIILLASHTGTTNAQAQTLKFNGSAAYGYVLKQMSFGPRIPGSSALLATASYIKENLTSYGWNITFQNFTYHNGLLNRSIEAYNIIAAIAHPLPSCLGVCNNILLGAHYDTRPKADAPNSPLANSTLPVPGADDGASGVAVLLELGRVIAANRPITAITMVFFDGEDSGNYTSPAGWIQGSQFYVHSLNATQRSQINAVIILDMVGYNALVLRRVEGSDYAISNTIWSQGRNLGYLQFASGIQPALVDDHRPFLENGIRAVDIIDFLDSSGHVDYPYWHTPFDTTDKVSTNSLEAVGRTVEGFIRSGAIVNPALPPSFFIILGALIVASATAILLLRKARISRATLVKQV